MIKAVLDTNQFVSGLILRRSVPGQVLQAWYEHKYILITSREILQEIERVLYYPHIFQKYRLTKKDIETVMTIVEHRSVIILDVPKVNIIKDDPTDNKILGCALAAKADYIVSGDRHLLDLRKYKDISIVTAREFLEIIGHRL